MIVASTEGTPRARIQVMTGAKADARMSAITTGIVTSVSCWMPQMMPAATATTTMIWIERMPSRPKPSAHRLHGARRASARRRRRLDAHAARVVR